MVKRGYSGGGGPSDRVNHGGSKFLSIIDYAFMNFKIGSGGCWQEELGVKSWNCQNVKKERSFNFNVQIKKDCIKKESVNFFL